MEIEQPQYNTEEATEDVLEKEATAEISTPKVAAFLLLLALFSIGLWYITRNGDVVATLHVDDSLAAEEESAPPPPNPFNTLILDAVAVYVVDIISGEVLFAQNEEMQLPLASLTKLMTVYTASLYLRADDIVVVRDESLTPEGDSGLFANENWKFKDLLDFTLIVSSNDGAHTLAAAAGVAIALTDDQPLTHTTFLKEMNANARKIGLTQTYFLNETGLDPTVEFSGSYGSARDITLLMSYILVSDPSLLSATTYTGATFYSLDNFMHEAQNTNEYIGKIPGLIASKTGFTDLAGGNLAIIFDAGIGHPIGVTVLGSTVEGRFTDVEQLVSAVLTYIAQ